MAEQHDRNERRELPPELEIEPTETRRDRRGERDGDRHRDEQHHAGLAAPNLVDRAGEERPAAPEEDDRAAHRRHDPHTGERQFVTEPLHDHARRRDGRDREEQTPPEPAPKHRRVIAMRMVIAVVAVVIHRRSFSGAGERGAERRGASRARHPTREASRAYTSTAVRATIKATTTVE